METTYSLEASVDFQRTALHYVQVRPNSSVYDLFSELEEILRQFKTCYVTWHDDYEIILMRLRSQDYK
jgi:hypothetical protein